MAQPLSITASDVFGRKPPFLRLQRFENTLDGKMRQLDWIGMGLFSVGCSRFVLPLSWTGAPFTPGVRGGRLSCWSSEW